MPDVVELDEVDTIKFSNTLEPVVKSRHYIDDAHLTGILSDWKRLYDEELAAGRERPRLPEEVGEAFYDMAEAMGKRHNFQNYSYLDEMRSDAILHCMKYIHNFNPNKKSEKKGKVSAFGYINMIIWRSFAHRIVEEKREQYLKYKSFELMGGMDAFKDEDMEVIGGGNDGDANMQAGVLEQDFMSKISEYEDKYGIGSKATRREKVVVFDDFMFNLVPENTEPESEYDDPDFMMEFDDE